MFERPGLDVVLSPKVEAVGSVLASCLLLCLGCFGGTYASLGIKLKMLSSNSIFISFVFYLKL